LIFALISAHSRISVGFGNIVALLIVSSFLLLSSVLAKRVYVFNFINDKKKLIAVTAVSVFGVLFISLSMLFVNYSKFGNIFSFMPLEKHIMFIHDNKRFERYLKFGSMNINNLKYNLLYYFGTSGFKIKESSPRLIYETVHSDIYRPDSIDGIEFTLSLIYSNPLLFLCIILGFIENLRKFDTKKNILILGSIFTFLITISQLGVTERYFHDFFPLFLFTGITGFNFLLSKYKHNKLILYLFMILIFYSVCVNLATVQAFQIGLLRGHYN
jgi:hypothetical protein